MSYRTPDIAALVKERDALRAEVDDLRKRLRVRDERARRGVIVANNTPYLPWMKRSWTP